MSDALNQLARQGGEWLRGEGPHHEIVISTRIRLARNLAGYPFLTRVDDAMREEIVEAVEAAAHKSHGLESAAQLDLADLDDLERALLVERHLISRQHAEGTGARCVVYDPAEAWSLMVNEEDHIRMQVMRSGLRLKEAWEQIDALDDGIDKQVDYAFHPKFGYLTACPTNVGTGIRVSVMLHLPALKLTNELEKVAQAARDMKLAVRGLFGEGTEALGDFFQISNQITLGRSEAAIIEDFETHVIPKIVEYEQAARDALLRDRLHAFDDKVYRAMGALQAARLISSNEAMQFLSHVRMGLHVGRLKDIDLRTINELFIQIQPAHLQMLEGERLSGEQRSIARAALIRSRIGQN